jgi:hypothetical protein
MKRKVSISSFPHFLAFNVNVIISSIQHILVLALNVFTPLKKILTVAVVNEVRIPDHFQGVFIPNALRVLH